MFTKQQLEKFKQATADRPKQLDHITAAIEFRNKMKKLQPLFGAPVYKTYSQTWNEIKEDKIKVNSI